MIRGSDPFWCYVEKMADGFLKCVFCGSIFAGSTSISRIKYHLARVKGGGVKLCEKVTPDVQRAAFDQLPNRMHGSMPSSSNNIIVTAGSDRAQDLEMQGQPLLDDDLSWMDSLIGGEILLTDENLAPGMPMPDAPETGSGTEPADQPFEMDMSNISSSLMQSVVERGSSSKRPVDEMLFMDMNNISSSLMQSVVERGSSSKRPVDRSVPSSSNNEATNAASTLVRGLSIEQPRLDDGLGGMETELVEEPRAAVVQRTEQAHQSLVDDVLRMCRNIMSPEYKFLLLREEALLKALHISDVGLEDILCRQRS